MRNSLYYIMSFLCSWALHAQTLDIIDSFIDGKPAYFLQAGAYLHQNEAKEKQKELSASIPYTIKIEHLGQQGLYVVKVGPLKDRLTAQQLQQQLTSSVDSIPSRASPSVRPTKSPKFKTWNLRNADLRNVIDEIS